MALDILAIPAMSSGIGWVFSSSALLLTHRLKEDVIEASECMKSWGINNPGGVHLYKDIEQVRKGWGSLKSRQLQVKMGR